MPVPGFRNEPVAGVPLARILDECAQNLECLRPQLHGDAVPQELCARRVDGERTELELFRCGWHLSGSPVNFTGYEEGVKGMLRSFKQHAQNGLANRGQIRRVPPTFGAATGGLCAFEEHAQNGSRPRRPGRVFLRCMAARDSALCAFKQL